MPTIYHLWGIRFLWKNKLVGARFMHLTIGSILKTCIWSRKYWPAKKTTHPIFHHDAKNCPSWNFFYKYWKSGSSGLGKMPAISHLWGKKIHRTSFCRWMIYSLVHWLIFEKHNLVKEIFTFQNNHSTCFAPWQKNAWHWQNWLSIEKGLK